MFSIYTSLYKLENSFIDWKGALDNFCTFADQVIVATTTIDLNTFLGPYCMGDIKSAGKVRLIAGDDKIVNNISFNDIDFDGKLKNLALKQCTQPFCILLDGDERIDVKDKDKWIDWADKLSQSQSQAFFIPVIDLYNTDKEYKSIGQKWYLHKNLPELNRGIVNFAKVGDKIDVNRSDTCELILSNGQLCYSEPICSPSLNSIKNVGIKVWHLGWLDKDKRLKSNAFWQPVWDNRAGKEVKNIIHSKEKLNKIEYFPHGLKLWYE